MGLRGASAEHGGGHAAGELTACPLRCRSGAAKMTNRLAAQGCALSGATTAHPETASAPEA